MSSICNLEGKTVKYHMYDDQDGLNGVVMDKNNNTKTCPAIVLTDWTPGTENLTCKALNLQVFPDCGEMFQASSVVHIENAGFYPVPETKEGEAPVRPIPVKKDHWEMY